MARWGVMFPGQGAQYVGMGRSVYDRYQEARETFQEADEALGYSLTAVIFNGPDDRIRDTEVQQPAILTASVAIWRVLKTLRPDWEPVLGLGLSLGEYTAYVAAGSLSFADAVRLTRIRGRAMQEAVPKGTGGMLAVLGLADDVVGELCRRAAEVGWVEPANYNAPGQVVISGVNEGLNAAETLVRQAGGRTVRLSVSAPFHSRLLESAGQVVAEALSAITVLRARFPVVANVDSALVTEPGEIVPRLVRQVFRPVQFEQGVRRTIAEGVDALVEVGPGRSLTSLVKKIERRLTTLTVEDVEGVTRALELV
ncbi:MAG: ACP S-malonyltransferase [Thermaerobacter sp.]|nr:ACP S-malonyltransferase [Thermaerobacter sp.]